MCADKRSNVDAVTGVTTTGHEWDGIRELNNPLPRWWLWVFYATIIWGVAYVLVYPAWPLVSSYTRGLFGWHSRDALEQHLADLKVQRGAVVGQMESASLADIAKDPKMLEVARALGRVAFSTNCGPCHGQGAQGAVGYPNLNDDQWIWGGSIEQIYQTIQYGIRNTHPDSRVGAMPAFGRDGLIPKADIPAIAAYVVTLSNRKPEGQVDLAKGQKLFIENCAACHGEDGKGITDVGAPNLTSNIWLYGGDEKTIIETIVNGRAGVMPGWADRLEPATVKALAVYVHTLGGGQ